MKTYESNYFSSINVKILRQTMHFNLDMATCLGEGKLNLNLLNFVNKLTLSFFLLVAEGLDKYLRKVYYCNAIYSQLNAKN